MIKNNKLYCDICKEEIKNDYKRLKNMTGIRCIKCMDKCFWWNKCFYNKSNVVIEGIEYLGHS